MTLVDAYAPLLLRVCLVVLFPFSGLDKIVNWREALKQAGTGWYAPAMLVTGIFVEFVTPVCIVTGWHDRLAAFVLAGFCAVTAVLYHQFWRFPDFRRFRPGEGLDHFWEFLKNFGLVGGLSLIVLSARPVPVSVAAQHPWASHQVIGPDAAAPAPASP